MKHFKKFQPTKEGYEALARSCIVYNKEIEDGVLPTTFLKDRDYIRMEHSYKKSLKA